jgi:hypothetical protein
MSREKPVDAPAKSQLQQELAVAIKEHAAAVEAHIRSVSRFAAAGMELQESGDHQDECALARTSAQERMVQAANAAAGDL